MPRASPLPFLPPRDPAHFFRGLPGLLVIALPWAWVVLHWGGVRPFDRLVSFAVLGAGVLLYRIAWGPHACGPPPAQRTLWALLALLGLAALQLVPLPLPLVALLSPVRAEAVRAVSGDAAGWKPLSIAPAETLDSFVVLVAAVLVGLFARSLTGRLGRRGWHAALPIIVVGAIEGLLGLFQQASVASPSGARGTYINHNHYAGLLELALPLALAATVLLIRRAMGSGDSRAAAGACAALVAAALIVAGLVSSFSRAGFAAAVAGALVFMVLAPGAGNRRRIRLGVAGAALAVGAGAFLLLPDGFIGRYADVSTVDALLGEGRVELWRETLEPAGAYRWFGSGLGTYQSAFWEFKRSWPQVTDDHAHNDYLETSVEFGLLGLFAALWLIGLVLARAVRLSQGGRTEEIRLPAAACAGAITALALHGLTDFNLAIPANALLFAWIVGMADGLDSGEWRVPVRTERATE